MPTLTECLQSDHRRLDAILVKCKALAAAGSFPEAATHFAAAAISAAFAGSALTLGIDANSTSRARIFS